MRTAFLAAGVVAGVVAAAWVGQGTGPGRALVQRLGLSADAAPPTAAGLAAAGVHKCSTRAGVVYGDQPCPAGSRELAAGRGTLNVVAFPKPAPPAASATALVPGLAGPIDTAERDRLRDKMIEDAANR